jgi:hypothetical protein
MAELRQIETLFGRRTLGPTYARIVWRPNETDARCSETRMSRLNLSAATNRYKSAANLSSVNAPTRELEVFFAVSDLNTDASTAPRNWIA